MKAEYTARCSNRITKTLTHRVISTRVISTRLKRWTKPLHAKIDNKDLKKGRKRILPGNASPSIEPKMSKKAPTELCK